MKTHRTLAAAAAVGLLAAGTAALPVSPAVAAVSGCPVFFDADGVGYDDLAVGTPGEDVTVANIGRTDAGSVTLVSGDATGSFGGHGGTVITQEDVGLVSHSKDRFGAAVLTADLNGDGCADLAIGIPGENSGAGAVVVLWGSAAGLDMKHPQVLAQGASPVGSAAEAGDGFGSSLAVAGSGPSGGAAALWVGSPGEDIGSVKDAGMITEVKASVGGLLGSAGVTNLNQDSPGIPGVSEPGDQFGEKLSGGARTLLVGVPHEDVGSLTDAGTYYALALSSRTWASYTQDSPGVPGSAESYDRFGSSVAHAAGCDGATDESWAVGSSGEDVGTLANAGSVTLRDRANGSGLNLVQGSGGIPGPAEAGDAFGASLVDAGELVIGSPGEDVGTAADSGVITLVQLDCTAAKALRVGAARTWSQATALVAGTSESGDRFGAALGASLVTVSGPALQLRLVVGSPGEAEGSVKASGNVTVFGTDALGLTATGSTAFGQATAGIDGEAETDDGFGGSLDAANATVL